MLGYYKYSRNEIAKIIRKSPKTKDGFYFVKNFPEMNNKAFKLDGENDKKYYYKRSCFENKYIFDNFELKCYLSEKEQNLDVDRMMKCDNQIADIIFDFLDYELKTASLDDGDYYCIFKIYDVSNSYTYSKLVHVE